MCDIFPDVDNCCMCFTLRIGMLLISILAIMTGVIGLSAIEQRTEINFSQIYNTNITKPQDAFDQLNTVVSSGISIMSCIFMFTGACLLFGALADSEGPVQIFVWVTFFNVLFGLCLVLAIGFECLTKSSCLLSDMDWLSGSALLILIIAYLIIWIYFICVANSYVVSIYE